MVQRHACCLHDPGGSQDYARARRLPEKYPGERLACIVLGEFHAYSPGVPRDIARPWNTETNLPAPGGSGALKALCNALPMSATSGLTYISHNSTNTLIFPPAGVYFTALPGRLNRASAVRLLSWDRHKACGPVCHTAKRTAPRSPGTARRHHKYPWPVCDASAWQT